MKIVIVDDEPKIRNGLSNYCHPDLDLRLLVCLKMP